MTSVYNLYNTHYSCMIGYDTIHIMVPFFIDRFLYYGCIWYTFNFYYTLIYDYIFWWMCIISLYMLVPLYIYNASHPNHQNYASSHRPRRWRRPKGRLQSSWLRATIGSIGIRESHRNSNSVQVKGRSMSSIVSINHMYFDNNEL